MSTNEQKSPAFKRTRIINVALVMLCMVFQNLALYGMAIFLPEIRKELGLSFTEGGALSAVSIFTYALMQIPAGYLADRFGYKRVFVIGTLATTMLFLAFGLISSYWQGLSIQAFSGLFRSFHFAPGLALVASWFSSDRRASAMSLSSAALFLGPVLMNGLGPSLAADSTWRSPFIIFGSIGIFTSSAYLLFGKGAPASSSHHKVDLREVFQLFRSRVMWVFGILQYVRFSIFQGIALWLPSLLIDEKGMALQMTGIIMAVRSFLVVPSNLMGAYISDRFRNPVQIITISLVIILITTALMVRVNDTALLIAIIMINGFFVQFYFGPLFAMPVEIVGKRMAGTATGFGNFFANLGSFTFVYLLGFLKDTSGSFEIGFYAMAGMCIVGLVFTFVLNRMRQKTQDNNQASS